MRFLMGLAAALAVLVFLMPGVAFTADKAGEKPASDAVRKVYAKVNEVELSELHFADAMNEIMPAAMFHGGITPEKREKYRAEAIEKMVERELYRQEAKKIGLQVPENWLAEQKDRIVKRLGGKAAFEQALARQGITQAEYDDYLAGRFLSEEFLRKEIKEKAAVSEEEARKYYEANSSMFVRPEARRLRMISIEVPPSASAEEWAEKERQAAEVLEKAKKGEDFGQLAWDHSTDAYKFKSGDLGLVHRGRLDQAIEDVAFSIPVGQMSDVIKSIYGYHIIKVEEEKKSEQLSFDEAKEKLMKDLSEKRQKELKEAVLKRLKDEARIEIY